MPNFSPTHWFIYNSSTSDPTEAPATVTANPIPSSAYIVYDGNNDGNIDSTDYFVINEVTYSGYTATIDGLDYAIFTNGSNFYLPYDSSIATPSTDTSTWTFNDVPENAVVVNCFLAGTMIATNTGEVAVESLKIGDEILSAGGKMLKIKWVGVHTVKNHLMAHDTKAPVCIAAGALGNGLPNADLYISADHGLIIDGLVVNAGALVNHSTIRFVPMAEMPTEFTYYHIETEAHDEILANGAPAETFIDYVGRKDFDNYQEYIDLYGCERIIPEMDRMRVSSQRQLPESFFERFNITHYDDQVAAELEKLEARLASDTEETDWDALLADPETRIDAKRNAA